MGTLAERAANQARVARSHGRPERAIGIGHLARREHGRAEQDGKDVVVTVQDSGGGLSGEEARTVFETRGSAKPGGMGIGLAISRAILEAHGGRLWAEAGAGGRFRFSLPVGTGDIHDA